MFAATDLPDLATIKRYFLGNGLLTWLLSPFNLFLDLISHRNKGIYCLQDLPSAYQQEISMLLQDININKDYLKKEMTEKLSINARGMLFFKWYGVIILIILFLLQRSIKNINL